jgi:hypothetical protein
MCGPLVPRYWLSLRDVKELLEERGLGVDHTTVWRWVQRYGPEMEQRMRRHLKATNKSWRADETYIRVQGAGVTCIGRSILAVPQSISGCRRCATRLRVNGCFVRRCVTDVIISPAS